MVAIEVFFSRPSAIESDCRRSPAEPPAARHMRCCQSKLAEEPSDAQELSQII